MRAGSTKISANVSSIMRPLIIASQTNLDTRQPIHITLRGSYGMCDCDSRFLGFLLRVSVVR